jgi:tight adherence protein B
MLEGLAKTMRARQTLRKRVKALSSEGRMSAYILSALPAGLIAFQLAFNPRFYSDKFSDPIFWPTAAIVGMLYIAGWLIMHRIMNFKY